MTTVLNRNFYIEQFNDVTVVCFTTSTIVEPSYEVVSDELFELVEHLATNGPIQVVLDLWSVRKIDDWGLALLRAFHETIEGLNGTVILCRIRPTVSQTMSSAELMEGFHICETSGEAICTFSNESEDE